MNGSINNNLSDSDPDQCYDEVPRLSDFNISSKFGFMVEYPLVSTYIQTKFLLH